ncbi:MAG: hypothetical protein ACLQB1_24815, partial [Streptosporangiaceae bacterium]
MPLEGVGGLPAGASSRLSPLGTCAAELLAKELAAVVCVAASPRMPSAASDPSAAAGAEGLAAVSGAG